MIRSALESPDSSAPNSGSNFVIRPLEADLVTFESAELPNKWKFLWFFCQLILLLMFQLNDFKSDEIGSKKSDYEGWLTVRRARFRAFQRTSNQYFPADTRPYGTLFVKTNQKKRANKRINLDKKSNYFQISKWFAHHIFLDFWLKSAETLSWKFIKAFQVETSRIRPVLPFMDFSNENWHFLWFFKNYHLPIGYFWKSMNGKTGRILDVSTWNALINFQESISTLFIQKSKNIWWANHFLWPEVLKIEWKKSQKFSFSALNKPRRTLTGMLARSQTGTWVWRPNSRENRQEMASAPV